ncbi:hypothetical protein [Geodermatophilus sp. SYSU D00696]
MTSSKLLRLVTGVVLAIGILLLVLPTSASALGDVVGCGSALDPSLREAIAQDIDDMLSGGRGRADWSALCKDRIETQRMIAWPLIVGGGLVLLYLNMNGQTSRLDSRCGRRAAPQESEGNEPLQ